MKIGSLFSGYAGLDAAVEAVTGARTVWVSDIDPGACKILAHHWPTTPNLGDITTIDWATVEPVDIITGGFPCQDVSMAGRRRGMKPGTRSGLWSQMAHAVDVLRPALVVAENVRGLLSADGHADVEPCPWCMGDADGEPAVRALGVVLADLADIGYDAAWYGLTAASIGAPHGRFRVFVIAWPATDTDGGGCEVSAELDSEPEQNSTDRDPRGQHTDGHPSPTNKTAWGQFEPAIRRWETLTRPAPAPTETGPKGGKKLSPRFVEWMQGLPDGHVTGVPGLTRNEQLKALGNGVVPAQAEAALRYLWPILTGDAAGSESPLTSRKLLPSPTARLGDGTSRGASHPDRRKELCAKRGGELDEVLIHLLQQETA